MLYPRAQVRAAAEDGQGGHRNAYPHAMTLNEAMATPGRPLVVYLTEWRRRVKRFTKLCGDFDTKHHGAELAAKHAAEYAAVLAAEDVAPVPAQSSPTGGWHIWSGCEAGLSSETVGRINRAAAVLWSTWDSAPFSNTESGAVRPPGAPHRNGGHSRLTAHTVEDAVRLIGPASAGPEDYVRVAERLEALAIERGLTLPLQAAADGRVKAGQVGPKVPRSIRLVDPENPARGERPVVRRVAEDEDGHPYIDGVPHRQLVGRAHKQLTRRLTDKHDHSHWFHAPLTAMAVRGWRFEQVAEVVQDAAGSPALEWLRTVKDETGARVPRTADDAAAVLKRAWFLAVEDAARLPRRAEDDHRLAGSLSEAETAAVELRRRMDAAGTARWSKQSGPADYTMMCVLSWLMIISDRLDVSADVRRLGVLAGYSPSTAAQALFRLISDGWLVVTEEANKRGGEARRVTLATAHECTSHRHHRCAVYTIPKSSKSKRQGSDRSANAAPQKGSVALSRNPRAALRTLLIQAQSDVWDSLGHHAARTHRAILQSSRAATIEALAKLTGYTLRTVCRHVSRLEELQLVTTSQTLRGRTVKATSRPLYEAARELGTAGRLEGMAVDARVDQAVYRWWLAEVAWRALSREEKRAGGRRAEADELVVPGVDPGTRKYPRFPGKGGRPECGPPDHARARRIEAERIDAAGLFRHAQQLARAGQLVDPCQLSPTGTVPSAPARVKAKRKARPRPAGVRPRQRRGGAVQLWLPGVVGEHEAHQAPAGRAPQLGCPHCPARAGQPCRRQDDGTASRPHKGRQTKARRLAERTAARRDTHG